MKNILIAVTAALLPSLAAQHPSPPGTARLVLDGTNAKTFAASMKAARTTLAARDRTRFDTSIELTKRLFKGDGPYHELMHNTPVNRVLRMAEMLTKRFDRDKDGTLSAAEVRVAREDLVRARLAANEAAAIATLKNCSSAQYQTQASGVIDANGNGMGEFAFFGEMTGAVGVRNEGTTPSKAFVRPPVLSSSFVVRHRVVERSGYLYQVWLPGADGRAVAEAPNGGVGTTAPDPARCESAFCIYAWPVKRGITGNRAFVLTEAGDIHATDNTKQRYSGRNAAPSPYAAFPKNTMQLGGLPTKLTETNDRGTWNETR